MKDIDEGRSPHTSNGFFGFLDKGLQCKEINCVMVRDTGSDGCV